jgi:hypothetical protein
MELETLIAYLMMIFAAAPFAAIIISNAVEAKRYKNLYNPTLKT